MRRNVKKWIAAALVLLFCAYPAYPVFAADNDQISQTEEMRTALQQKYGVSVNVDISQKGEPLVGPGTLSTLDAALNTVTPGVVRQVSQYYYNTRGKALTFRFTNSTYQLEDPSLLVLGEFEEEQSTISIFVPPGSGAAATGCSPLSILHEFAHAFHKMAEEQYGEEQMKAEWMALNGSVSNNEGYMVYPYNKVVFISSYAASSYGEDFAETFAHVFARDRAGLGFQHRMFIGEKKTALWSKVNYLEKLIPQILTDAGGCVANLQKSYSTPVFLQYQGIRLSDEDLQFIGYNPPINVLKGVLSANGLKAESSQWIAEVGGWQVETAGGYYLAFPGGKCVKTGGAVAKAAEAA